VVGRGELVGFVPRRREGMSGPISNETDSAGETRRGCRVVAASFPGNDPVSHDTHGMAFVLAVPKLHLGVPLSIANRPTPCGRI